jgi:hypothetical protein
MQIDIIDTSDMMISNFSFLRNDMIVQEFNCFGTIFVDERYSHNTTQHNTTQHNTTQHNTTQHNTKSIKSTYSPGLSNVFFMDGLFLCLYTRFPIVQTYFVEQKESKEGGVIYEMSR